MASTADPSGAAGVESSRGLSLLVVIPALYLVVPSRVSALEEEEEYEAVPPLSAVAGETSA